MAGLSIEGFTPLTEKEIIDRIHTRLLAFSPDMDLSTESPDGQLVEIFSFELAQAWNELSQVFHSYNPDVAIGAGLRNVGMITGLPYGAATRSQANVELDGVAGTTVSAGSVVADSNGNEFATTFSVTLPATVQVIATVSGGINTDIGTINTIVSEITGWDSINQPIAGRVGGAAQTDIQYRNLRNRTVLRNSIPIAEVLKARIVEKLGITQVLVSNNDSTITLGDGTPANHIQVMLGEYDTNVITDEAIARLILETKGLGCLTHGTEEVLVTDTQGFTHPIKFSKAVAINVFIKLDVLFLDEDYAGAVEAIRSDLLNYIENLDAGEDVVWSRLFGIITPYAKADVRSLELSIDGVSYTTGSNVEISSALFAFSEAGDIMINTVNP